MDWLIGGVDYVGKGWCMLVECFLVGCGIFLFVLGIVIGYFIVCIIGVYGYVCK